MCEHPDRPSRFAVFHRGEEEIGINLIHVEAMVVKYKGEGDWAIDVTDCGGKIESYVMSKESAEEMTIEFDIYKALFWGQKDLEERWG